MNQINTAFQKAQTADIRQMLGIAAADNRDYLVVTGLDLHERLNLAVATPSNAFKIPLTDNFDADETLNKITRWMLENDAMNQYQIHGSDMASYSVGFYMLYEGTNVPTPPLANEFYLAEHTFAHCLGQPLHGFDDLMRKLDRDVLAKAMRRSLIEDVGIPARENAPAFWMRDIRYCSHPDMASQREAVICRGASSPRQPAPAL